MESLLRPEAGGISCVHFAPMVCFAAFWLVLIHSLLACDIASKCRTYGPPPGKPVTFYECHPEDHAPAPSVRADFQQKNMCFAIWARVNTKFLNSSHHVLSVDDWPGDATFFLWGQPLKIIRKYSVKKGPAPWILFLTPAPWPLEVTFLVGEGEHMCLYPFVKSCKESYPLN